MNRRIYMIINGIKSLGLPHGIGCYRAGGDFMIVRQIIQEVFEKTDLKIILYKLNKG